MVSAIISVVLLAAQPCDAYGECEECRSSASCFKSMGSSDSKLNLGAHCLTHIKYHKRLYYGHFDRHPFDYRFQFDYIWHAGPSQIHWPIPPLPAVTAAPCGERFEAQRTLSKRISIATRPNSPIDKPDRRSTLVLKTPR